MSMSREGCTASLVAAVVVLLAALPVGAQTLSSIAEQAESLSGRMDRINTDYVRYVELVDEMGLASQLADGRVRYLLEEYDAAAIILVAVVENDSYRYEPGYTDARFMLADSLFLTRNFVMARGYFEDIIDDDDDEYGLDAARRLLEIAFALNQYDGLDELYAQLQRQRGGNLGPEVSYVRAKAQYFSGEYDAALDSFSSIDSSSDLYTRARYFIGVIRVREGLYDEALAEFDHVLTLLDTQSSLTSQEQELVELTLLAQGRVHYELGQWNEAILAYAQVPRQSTRFDEALYEISWTMIREDRYSDAIENLEILALVSEEEQFVAESELLRGDLLMRLSRYEDAVELFESVDAEYEPVEQELEELIAGRDDPNEYFEALVNPESGALRLPQIAIDWVDDDAIVGRSLDLVFDIATLEDAIEESRTILEQLETAITAGARVEIFPHLREGWGLTLEVQNEQVGLLADLVEFERGLVWVSMPSDAQNEYERLQSRRETAEDAFLDLPQTFSEMSEHQAEVIAFIDEMILEVYRTEQEIQLSRNQLEAMREMLADQVRAGERTREEGADIRAELDSVEAELDRREREAQRLRDELSRSQLAVGMGDDLVSDSDALRRDYVEALEAEREYLAGYRSNVSGRSSDFQQLDATWGVLVEVGADVASTLDAIDAIVDDQTAEVQAILAEERELLSTYERMLRTYQRQSNELAGAIAYDAFVRVQEQLTDLTLRSNLGIIDVAWRQKEEITEQISDLFDERNRALEILDADFEELLLEE